MGARRFRRPWGTTVNTVNRSNASVMIDLATWSVQGMSRCGAISLRPATQSFSIPTLSGSLPSFWYHIFIHISLTASNLDYRSDTFSVSTIIQGSTRLTHLRFTLNTMVYIPLSIQVPIARIFSRCQFHRVRRFSQGDIFAHSLSQPSLSLFSSLVSV